MTHIVNYFKYTTEQLWEALRIIDASIAEAPTDRLVEARKELISFFEENIGYNPDNLCTSTTLENKIDQIIKTKGI